MLALTYSVERKSRTRRCDRNMEHKGSCSVKNPVNIGVRGMELLADSAQNMHVQSIIVEGCLLG